MPISLAVLENIVREAGAIALVTEADVAIEAFLKERLTQQYPQFGFWGEESGQTADQTSRWIVDPIDGTHSFSKG